MIAVSLGERNTDLCLQKLNNNEQKYDIAEICLDLMVSFDLEKLIRKAPCPLIISYRPIREGGSYEGSEKRRIETLVEAVNMSVAYVDIEWDSIDKFKNVDFRNTKVLLSRHWHNEMPDLIKYYNEYKHQADIIKLVGMSNEFSDNLQVFTLLNYAATPIIGIGMGYLGQITRILAPCFNKCFLTFGSNDYSESTAPGQLSITKMVKEYHVDHIGIQTKVEVDLFANVSKEGLRYIRDIEDKVGEKLNIGIDVFPQSITKVKEKLMEYFNVRNLVL